MNKEDVQCNITTVINNSQTTITCSFEKKVSHHQHKTQPQITGRMVQSIMILPTRYLKLHEDIALGFVEHCKDNSYCIEHDSTARTIIIG